MLVLMPHSEGISSNCTPAMRVMNKKSGGKQLTQQSYDLVTVLLFAILFFLRCHAAKTSRLEHVLLSDL